MKTIRRLYIYLVTLISLEVVVWALISLARSIFETGFSLSTESLAGGLAFILVGLPVFFFHWWLAKRDAEREEDERNSGVRAFFLYAAWSVLAVPVVQNVLSILLRSLASMLDVPGSGLAFGYDQNFSDNLIAMLVNIVLVAYFQRVISQNWQSNQTSSLVLMRRINRYFWMLYSFGLMYSGIILLLLFITEDEIGGVSAALVNGLSFALVGSIVWVYVWRIIQRSTSEQAEKFSRLRLIIIYALSLLGALATLIPVAFILSVFLNSLFGASGGWTSFISENSLAISFLVPSAAFWFYFRHILWQDTGAVHQLSERAAQRRVYYYVLSLAGLLATFISLQLLAYWMIEMFVPPREVWGPYVRQQLASTLAALAVGLPIWLLNWRTVQTELLPGDEQSDHAGRSILRRGYLYLILLVGVIGTMISAGTVLFELIQLALGNGDESSLEAILEMATLLILFVIFSLYHWRLLRSDGQRISQTLAEKHAAFPVVIFETGDGQLSTAVTIALQEVAPSMPVIFQQVGKPFAEEIGKAAVAVLPSPVLTDPTDQMRTWLAQFSGTRVVLPLEDKNWLWAGITELSTKEIASQTARMITKFAEEQDTRQRKIQSPLAIIGIVLGVLFGIALLCIAATAIINLF